MSPMSTDYLYARRRRYDKRQEIEGWTLLVGMLIFCALSWALGVYALITLVPILGGWMLWAAR